MVDARLEPQTGAGRAAIGRWRALLLAASGVGVACTLLAPSDDELRGGTSALDPGAGAGGSAVRAPDAGRGGTAADDGATGGTAPVDIDAGPTAPGDAGGRPDAAVNEPPAEACGIPVDCARIVCDGLACADFGRRCAAGECDCPGGDVPESDCANGTDDDCDGLEDCLDPDCERERCGSDERRCCAGRCVDTTQDEEHCQGCDLRCAPGQLCVRIEDASGVRGHCSCDATTECPNNPAQICRQMNGDGQDDLCACDVLQTGNDGCAIGQVCQDVPLANFCSYPAP